MSNVFVQVGVGFPLLLAFLLWVGRVRKAVVDPLEAQAEAEWQREMLDRAREYGLNYETFDEMTDAWIEERAALDAAWGEWYAINQKEDSV